MINSDADSDMMFGKALERPEKIEKELDIHS